MLKKRFYIFRLVGSALISYLALYTFLQSSIYITLKETLTRIFTMAFGSFTLLIRGPTLLFILITALVIIIPLLDRRGIEVLYVISLFLYFPSLLMYSGVEWWNAVGSVIETKVSFFNTLIIGIVIVTTYLSMTYISKLENYLSELRERDITAKDAENIIWSQMLYILKYIGIAGLVALTIYFIVTYSEPILNNFLTSIPFSHGIIGISSILIVLISIYLYIHSIND